MARGPVKKTVESRLTAVERGIKSLQASDATIIRSMRDGFSQMDGRFADVEGRFAHMESRFDHMDSRFDQIYNHIDGFMKLHETLDIEFRVIKEQMRRLEQRVEQLETTGRS
jgi:predicted  nucleic acid-binding Zn-ribbon protein